MGTKSYKEKKPEWQKPRWETLPRMRKETAWQSGSTRNALHHLYKPCCLGGITDPHSHPASQAAWARGEQRVQGNPVHPLIYPSQFLIMWVETHNGRIKQIVVHHRATRAHGLLTEAAKGSRQKEQISSVLVMTDVQVPSTYMVELHLPNPLWLSGALWQVLTSGLGR